MKRSRLLLLPCAVGFTLGAPGASVVSAAPEAPVPLPASSPPATLPPSLLGQNAYDLSAFGPVGTPAQASQTLEKAIAAIQGAGGGVIVIPVTAPSAWVPQNNGQEEWRKPEAPAPAKSWGVGPGVTLFDARSSHFTLPQVSGLEVDRDFTLAQGQSAPHWSMHPMLTLRNNYTGGTSDFEGALTQDTPVGKDQKFWLESLQGVFPGQVLEVQGTARGTLMVKSLGYDRQSHQGYIVADALMACPAGTVLEARTIASAIEAKTRANNELQTFDVYNIRHHYSQGDTYMFSGRAFYMGDNYAPRDGVTSNNSSADEERASGYGSVIYNARTQSETNIFRGVVESRNVAQDSLNYKEGRNVQTLATGRPLINLNPKKWITAGHAYLKEPTGSGWLLNTGDSLWSTDAPWTEAVVGRYFAVDQPDEYVPTGDNVRRWYLITGFSVDADGAKHLTLRRYWWGAKNTGVGISALYNYANFSFEGQKPTPLKYVIAPGSYVYEVADSIGINENPSAAGHLIKIAPYSDGGTASDFAAGDPIEQAIGPEPYTPVPFRAWMFDEVPGAYPAPVFDVANRGTPRDTVLSVSGSGRFNSVINVSARCKDGIVVKGDVDNAFLLIKQKGPLSPDAVLPAMAWDTYFWPEQGKRTRGTTSQLGLMPANGALTFSSSWGMGGQSAVGVRSLGDSQSGAGANLRGISVPVAVGATACDVVFPTAEVDGNYAITIQPTWLTEHAVTTRTAQGFHVVWSQPAGSKASFDWLLVR